MFNQITQILSQNGLSYRNYNSYCNHGIKQLPYVDYTKLVIKININDYVISLTNDNHIITEGMVGSCRYISKSIEEFNTLIQSLTLWKR